MPNTSKPTYLGSATLRRSLLTRMSGNFYREYDACPVRRIHGGYVPPELKQVVGPETKIRLMSCEPVPTPDGPPWARRTKEFDASDADDQLAPVSVFTL